MNADEHNKPPRRLREYVAHLRDALDEARHIKRAQRIVVQPNEAVTEERVRRRPLRRVLSQAQTDEVAELRREACAVDSAAGRAVAVWWVGGGWQVAHAPAGSCGAGSLMMVWRSTK